MSIKNTYKLLISGACLSSSLWAVTDEAVVLDDYIVRSDLLQRSADDIAQSVTVLGGVDLEEKNVSHFEDLILRVPGLTYTGGSSRARFLQIRGVGEFDTYEEPVISAVGLTLDEVDYAGLGVIGNGFALEQVEVFRGPQAGRYGSSALAGSVNLYSLGFSDVRSGAARVGVSERGGKELGLTIATPLGEPEDGLSLRLIYNEIKEDGYITNDLTGRKGNFIDETTFIGKLQWEQNEHTTWELFAHYFDINNGYEAVSVNNSFTTTADFPGTDEFDVYTIGLTGQFNAPSGFDIRSISYLSKRDNTYSFDSDWQSLNNFERYARSKNIISQEIRFQSDDEASESFGWSLGTKFNYAEEESFNVENYDDFFFRTERFNEYEDTNLTIYGEALYDLSDRLRVNAGLRIENRNFAFNDQDLGSTGLGPLPSDRNLELNEWLWGGQIGLEFDVVENHNLFANLSRGYRGGGFNTDPFNFDANNERYEDESLYSAEIGWRGKPNENLSYKINAFYQHRENAQLRRFGGEPFFEFAVVNADEASAYGLESEIVYFLTDAWKWELSLAFIESEVTLAEVPVLAEGRDQAFTPTYKVSLDTEYRFENGLFIGGDMTAIDQHFFDAYHNVESGAYEIFNFRTGFRANNWEVVLWVKNIFDQTYGTRAFNFSQILAPENGGGFTDTQGFIEFGAPRTVGVQANYRF